MMDREYHFGKMSLQKKVMKLKYSKGISLQEAWDEVLKKNKPKTHSRKSLSPEKLKKKMLDTMSLKKLRLLALKYKVSISKKNSEALIKKSTLLNRLKKHRSIKKILESANKMKRTKFGQTMGYPPLNTPTELATGMPYSDLKKRYLHTSVSLTGGNLYPNRVLPPGSTLPSQQAFGQYFH